MLLPMLVLLFSCGKDESNSKISGNEMTRSESNKHAGEVIESMDAGSYSYLHLKENDLEYWIAVPQMTIENGEMIYFSQFMEMRDFKSETLDRTFDKILFVSDAGKTPKNNIPQTGAVTVGKQSVTVDKVPGGMTIAEIYKSKDLLHRKKVKVRGKVVKFNGGIMDRNWIHIQDGTADNNNFDLLITAKESVTVGDVIVAEGEIVLDQDFGAGYAYAVLLENAKITK
jgi:hypothetical protein